MVTMKEVARAAGVSQASVSNAYNRTGRLSESQRGLILEVAERLGYLGPDPAGRSLRTGKVGAIGLMFTDSLAYAFDDPSAVFLLKGVAEVGELADIALTLLPFPPPREGEDAATRNRRDAQIVQRSLVDGFLMYSMPDDHPAVTAAIARGLPTVIVDSPTDLGVDFVGVRDRRAAKEIAAHLLALGHTRIGILVDRLNPDGASGLVSTARLRAARDAVPAERVAGYAQAIRAAGLRWADVPIVEAGGFTSSLFRAAVEKLISHHGLTAIIASTDGLALTAIEVLAERGVSVPRSVSVVGFDDLPAAETAGLTTVRQPLVEKGRRAAMLLTDPPTGRPRRIYLETGLVVRTSTARVRRGR